MNLPLLFAWRYIFSKKSTQAIHIISAISVLGIALGSMALLVILSVFNGFEDLLRDLIGKFKPDLQITAVEGKIFSLDSAKIDQIRRLDGVQAVSKTLEEIALFEYDGLQNLARIKGVDVHFQEVIDLDTMLTAGRYQLTDAESGLFYAVVGSSLEGSMGISPNRANNRPITVFMPKRDAKKLVGTAKPFRQRDLIPAGVYSVQQADYDNFVIADLGFVQELLAYTEGEMSALEIRLTDPLRSDAVQAQLQELLGAQFSVKNRYQQDEAFFKITNLEKWVGYIIFTFTLMLVAFNMVGALWMLVLEKVPDIATLKALGASNGLVRRIFLAEGFLLSLIGLAVGCVAAVVLCVLQQQYGLVPLEGQSLIISAYPVAMRWFDFALVIATVLGIGGLASWLPALRAGRVEGIVRSN